MLVSSGVSTVISPSRSNSQRPKCVSLLILEGSNVNAALHSVGLDPGTLKGSTALGAQASTQL